MVSKWAIVGGGMLGITLAYRLLQQGHQVDLIEAAPSLGGLASAWRLGDVTWDRHYHVTLLSDTRLRALLSDIGLEAEMQWVETKTGFYTDGQLYSMSNTLEFLKFPPLGWLDKLRLGGNIFLASRLKNWRRLETQPVARWLERWSGRRTYEKIWLPLLRAKLGDAYQRVSAAFIWAHIQRMYKARRTGLKKEMFGYVPGGYARILETLAAEVRRLGGTIRLSSPVTEVLGGQHQPVRVALKDGQTHEYDNVVFTVPSPLIARTVPQLGEDERRRHEGIEYLGIICASLLLPRPLSPYYVTNITDSSLPFTAVIEMTTIVDPAQLDGHTLVYLPKYLPQDHPFWNHSDAEIQQQFLDALERMHPQFSRSEVGAFRISRVRNVMALPTLNYSRRLPPMTTSVPGVFAVNSAHILKGNLNVNETIEIAEMALSGCLAQVQGRFPATSDPKPEVALSARGS